MRQKSSPIPSINAISPQLLNTDCPATEAESESQQAQEGTERYAVCVCVCVCVCVFCVCVEGVVDPRPTVISTAYLIYTTEARAQAKCENPGALRLAVASLRSHTRQRRRQRQTHRQCCCCFPPQPHKQPASQNADRDRRRLTHRQCPLRCCCFPPQPHKQRSQRRRQTHAHVTTDRHTQRSPFSE